ncbi:hypothetical protein MNBD_NITROSPINAE02-714 [hydrothermal vent metagenome]|uniref:Uncharacterized protein n=1 Tax=hydrothermal vent metagenome TaxID=652676 RepID=A0A3B1CIS2_9ZZZZ
MADSIVLAINCFVTLFSVLDPFGAAIIFLALTPGYSDDLRARQVKRTITATTITLATFTVLGGLIFAIFGISIHALVVAGGLILVQIGFKMLAGELKEYRSTKSEMDEAELNEDIAIIPMAIPMLAGPAAITTMMIFASRATGKLDTVMIFLALFLALGVTYLILKRGRNIAEWLGETGARILTRILGLIVLAMGVEFILSGVKGYFG